MTYSWLVSLKSNYKGILLMLVSALLVSVGQLCWKLADGANLTYLAAGFILYGCGALLMIVAFRFGSLSVLHPLLSTSYLFALLIGGFILNEPIGVMKVIGVTFVALGVILIGCGDCK